MVVGTLMAGAQHFQSSIYPLHVGPLTVPGYAALYSLIANLVLAVVGTVVLDLMGAARGADETLPDDYLLERAGP
jgi:SSS family solute:Na+ symporter